MPGTYFLVSIPHDSGMDRWDMMAFCRKRDFVTMLDAWKHAGKYLPDGVFLTIYDNRGMTRAWGYNGGRLYPIVLMPSDEGEEEHG